MKRINKIYILLLIPIILFVVSYYPFSYVVKKAKFHEKWVQIVAGIENVAENKESESDFYSSDLLIQILHVYETDGLFIAKYDKDLTLLSDPQINAWTTFNPLDFNEFFATVFNHSKKEFQVTFRPDGESARKAYIYFRWVNQGSKRYLIVVASSHKALQTNIEYSILIYYMTSLLFIIASVLVVVLLIYQYEITKIRQFVKNDGGKEDAIKHE